MSRGRKRKSNKGLFSPESMKRAVKDVLEHKIPLRVAAERYGLKFQTLARYVKKTRDKPNNIEISYKPHYDTRRIFSEQQENLLKEYVLICSNMGYGKSTKDVRQLAYELCIENNIALPEQWQKNKTAGVDWLKGFLKRHPDLSVRQPEGCSLSRATSFNRHNVEKFFTNLEEVLKRNDGFLNGTRIFNLDETATTTVQKSARVIAKKGIKQINKVTSGERGVLVTTCCIISAAGTTIPPAMVFPRVNFKPHMLHGAPAGTLGLANPSGWMTAELFESVMKHFIKHTASSKSNPSLLILDNHDSHFSVGTLNLAKGNGVTMLTLPPHTSNKLQPLDVSVYGPFKCYYNNAIDSFMMKNPGIPISIFQIAECVSYALDKAMTPENIKSGFKKCGIMPFDRNVFQDYEFLLSSVTDRDLEVEQEANLLNESIQGNSIEISEPVEPSTPEKNLGTISGFKSPQELFGFPKAQPRKKIQTRKKGSSKIVTDTPEKTAIEKQFHEKKRKELLKLSKGTKRKLNPIKSTPSTSSESDVNSFISDSSDSESFEDLNLELNKEANPDVGSYVVIEFHDKKSIFYVAKILERKNDEYKVSYLRYSAKVKNSFIFPAVEDVAFINPRDIKYTLPAPVKSSGTKRQQSYVTFGLKFDSINIR